MRLHHAFLIGVTLAALATAPALASSGTTDPAPDEKTVEIAIFPFDPESIIGVEVFDSTDQPLGVVRSAIFIGDDPDMLGFVVDLHGTGGVRQVEVPYTLFNIEFEGDIATKVWYIGPLPSAAN